MCLYSVYGQNYSTPFSMRYLPRFYIQNISIGKNADGYRCCSWRSRGRKKPGPQEPPPLVPFLPFLLFPDRAWVPSERNKQAASAPCRKKLAGGHRERPSHFKALRSCFLYQVFGCGRLTLYTYYTKYVQLFMIVWSRLFILNSSPRPQSSCPPECK